ncbi:DUF6248 family natural product biosynthesis protein [Streptomyces sp. NPDC050428]|uniref:DUF6248 family natural product biosynthesis protein n=1 Tax=Streptomyces sp. NPDC050428 TaxID=3155757 RepID=UPI003433208E
MNETASAAGREPRARNGVHTVIRRPQRTLTPEEHQLVQGTALLNLHGALIMGIVDPVPNPSPMSETEGAWVRERVWPAHFLIIDRKYPWGFHQWATCERGTCRNCLGGRCDLCVHRQKGGPHVDDNTDRVWSHKGRCVARLILRPGDEPCVWWCRCSCLKDDLAAAPAPLAVTVAGTERPGPDGAAAHTGARRARGHSAADWSQNALF